MQLQSLTAAASSPRRAASTQQQQHQHTDMDTDMDLDARKRQRQRQQALIIDLHRLLYAMQAHPAPTETQSWQALEMRVALAESLWEQLLDAISPDEDCDPAMTQKVYGMEERVLAVTAQARECVVVQQQEDASVDYRARIFLAPQRQALLQDTVGDEATNDFDDDDDNNNDDNNDNGSLDERGNAVPFRSDEAASPTKPTPSVQDLQTVQREQIEEAISQMAAQLKAESARIHTTLQGQVVGLDAMEDLATSNVQKVTAVAADVKMHVASNWRRTLGTWTLLFTMAGTFLACLVTIQMIPKRAGACLFNCPAAADQFCRILPNGHQECLNLEQWEQRRDEPVAMDAVILDTATVNIVAVNTATSDTATTDPDTATLEPSDDTTEVSCQMGMDGECLPLLNTDRTVIPQQHFNNMGTPMDETLKIFEAAQKAPPKAPPATPQKVAGATGAGGGGDLGGLFSEVYVAEEGAEAVPVYNGRPFAPSDIRSAAAEGDIESLAGMLKIKPEWVDNRDKNDWTALHLAVRTGSVDLVEVLLDAGGNCDLATRNGRDVFDVAVDSLRDDHPILEQLLNKWKSPEYKEKFFSTTDLCNAASDGDLELLSAYLQVKPDWVNKQGEEQWTALHFAARTGSRELVQVLLDAGSDAHLENNKGQTALDVASSTLGEDNLVVELLEVYMRREEEPAPHEAPEDLAEYMGELFSPADLRFAAGEGNVELLEGYLKVKPEWIDLQDDFQWTALHEAAREGSLPAVQLLLEAGADDNLETMEGETALDIAVDTLDDSNPVITFLEEW